MFWRFLSSALGTVVLLPAQSDPPTGDDLIVPGVRVGPVTRKSTEISLIKLLGKNAVLQNVDIGEGDFQPGLVIYKNDPMRRLEIVWNRDVPFRPRLLRRQRRRLRRQPH